MPCCTENIIELPKSGVQGPPGRIGEPGIQGITGLQGANGINGGQEIYQTNKIVFNSIWVPLQHNGANTSVSNPFTVTLLSGLQLSPKGGPNAVVGGLLNNIFYTMGNGQDSSGPYDFDIQVWWRQSLNNLGVFITPCNDARLLGYVQKIFIDNADSSLKMNVTNWGVYRTVILG